MGKWTERPTCLSAWEKAKDLHLSGKCFYCYCYLHFNDISFLNFVFEEKLLFMQKRSVDKFIKKLFIFRSVRQI